MQADTLKRLQTHLGTLINRTSVYRVHSSQLFLALGTLGTLGTPSELSEHSEHLEYELSSPPSPPLPFSARPTLSPSPPVRACVHVYERVHVCVCAVAYVRACCGVHACVLWGVLATTLATYLSHVCVRMSACTSM